VKEQTKDKSKGKVIEKVKESPKVKSKSVVKE
jgi:hypothetical protein